MELLLRILYDLSWNMMPIILIFLLKCCRYFIEFTYRFQFLLDVWLFKILQFFQLFFGLLKVIFEWSLPFYLQYLLFLVISFLLLKLWLLKITGFTSWGLVHYGICSESSATQRSCWDGIFVTCMQLSLLDMLILVVIIFTSWEILIAFVLNHYIPKWGRVTRVMLLMCRCTGFVWGSR